MLVAYRVKSGDARGVLQMSPTGGMSADDWVDMAIGVTDLQFAVRVYEADSSTDPDGDTLTKYNWYSGANMYSALDPTVLPVPPARPIPLQVRLSILAKTTSDVPGPTRSSIPPFLDPAMPTLYNDVGNRAAIALPVSDTSSPYYGNFLYRWSSVIIDLRNLGTNT